MAFVNASLLLGSLLVGIPILLHLLMRQRPKHLLFPAMRFLVKRRETNQRKLQLRHWLLLALRCLSVLLLVLAFARPSVSATLFGRWSLLAFLSLLLVGLSLLWVVCLLQRRGRVLLIGVGAVTALLFLALTLVAWETSGQSGGAMLGDREAPVTALLLFDTSPRMEYRYHNQTRLAKAQEIADWLVRQLPADSQIAVVDSRAGPVVYSVDLAAATKAIERLETTGVPEPMPSVLDRVFRLAFTGRHARKEVYIFSDLTAASWPANAVNLQIDSSPDLTNLSLYVVDVGVPNPTDVGMDPPNLSAQSLTVNNDLEIRTNLHCLGTDGPKVVELFLEESDSERPIIVDGKPLLPVARPVGREVVTLDDGETGDVVFQLPVMEPGVHQGYLSVAGSDGLPSDDIRYFAVEAREAWPVLVAAPPGVAVELFVEAIAPYGYIETGRSQFDCTVVPQTDLANQTLDNYSVVCLLDPKPLPPSSWDQLRRYVRDGGALALFLGHEAWPVASFQADIPRQLVGGKLVRKWRAGGRDLVLAPETYDHPVLAEFRPFATSTPWSELPVMRHWVLDPLEPNAHALLDYSNGKPALIESTLGKGRTLVMTTPVTEPTRPDGREAWNELATSEAWPYVVLVNEMMLYLAGAGERQLNFLCGDTAVLPNQVDKDPDRYQLFTPREEPQEMIARDGSLTVPFTETPGAYRLKGHRGSPVIRGFAVNLPSGASDLSRLPRERLDQMLGKEQYQLARSKEEIVREVGETRVGSEFYPYLVALLAIVLALEYLLANRFYRRREVETGNQSLRDFRRHDSAA